MLADGGSAAASRCGTAWRSAASSLLSQVGCSFCAARHQITACVCQIPALWRKSCCLHGDTGPRSLLEFTCRPAAAHLAPLPGVYGGADAAACALASRFPLQQLGAGVPPCSGLPASLFAPTQQNLHL